MIGKIKEYLGKYKAAQKEIEGLNQNSNSLRNELNSLRKEQKEDDGLMSLYDEEIFVLTSERDSLRNYVSDLEESFFEVTEKNLALEEALLTKNKKPIFTSVQELYPGYANDVVRSYYEGALSYYKTQTDKGYRTPTGREMVLQSHYNNLPKYSKKYEKLMKLVNRIFLTDGNPSMKEIEKLEHFGFKVTSNHHYVISTKFGIKMEFSSTPSRKIVGRKCKAEFMKKFF